MKSIRSGLAGMLMTGGVLLAAAASVSPVHAADPAAVDPAVAPAGPGAGPHPWGHGGPGGHGGYFSMYRQLGLSSEQQASIKAIMTAAAPQLKSLHEQMRSNHMKMMQTKPDDPNYGNMVAEVSQSNATLASRLTSQNAELRTQMYAVLTPAQKTQLAALEAERAAHPHHGPGGHGPDGPPPAE